MSCHDAYGDRLEKCYSGAVYDTLRAIGFPNQLLPQTIRLLDPERADPVEDYLQFRKF